MKVRKEEITDNQYVIIKSIRHKCFKAHEVFGLVTKGECSLFCLPDRLYGNYFEKFDSQGNSVEKEFYDCVGNCNEKFCTQYNEVQQAISIDIYNQDNELESKLMYDYDTSGLLHTISTYEPSGDLKTKTTYKYNELGLKVESSIFDNRGNLKSKKTIDYDNKEREIYFVDYHDNRADGEIPYMKVDTSYNERGYDKIVESRKLTSYNRKTEIARFENKTSFFEDKLLTLMILDESNKLSPDKYKFEYQMDMNNNWVVRTAFKNDIPVEISERTIEYN